jgi:hypothetical protein
MDIYEELVMRYLCDGKPYIFLSPNFRLAGGWAFPDFVVLNFRDKLVSVVEVTTSANPRNLVQKIEQRKFQWLDRLKEQLERNSVIDNTWKFSVQAFVREDVQPALRERFEDQDDVEIHPLTEEILHAWRWDWTERE